MNENQQLVERKQQRRYEVLLELWKAADGREMYPVSFKGIAKNNDFTDDEIDEIFNYFNAEGFFINATFGYEVSLSHAAILEIEKSIQNPNQPTEHFSLTVIQHFNAPVGAVQNASNSVANITQNIGQSIPEVLEQIAVLRSGFQSLQSEERQEAIEVVDALEVEVQSESPSRGKLKSFLLVTRDFCSQNRERIGSFNFG